jgi:rubrerythrin
MLDVMNITRGKMNGKKTIIHILFGFCLFPFVLSQAVSSENNVANYSETISVLQELYKAENIASNTYSEFSRKALKEGYYSVARLFSALSESESVHARNFKNVLKDLGVETENFPEPCIKISDTKENLKFSLNVEISEIDTNYPKLIKRIKPEGNEKALKDIACAWKAEMQHKDLIHKMKSSLWLFFGKIVDKLKETHVYNVCQRCGSTVFKLPEKSCVICGSPVSMHKQIK